MSPAIDAERVGTKSRSVDIGTSRGRDLTIRAGQELRLARTDRGLSLATVGGAVALSISQVSRIERGLVRHVSVRDLARLHAVVGLDLSVKSYPSGQPIRDAVHIRLLNDLRRLLHRSLLWSVEVPIPIPGDQRSWDAMIRTDLWRYTVEAETAPRDAQALVRRIQLKRRDGQVDGVLLLLRRTTQTRRFLGEAHDLLRAEFPVDGGRALELLGAGVEPGGSAVIVLGMDGQPWQVKGPFAAGANKRR